MATPDKEVKQADPEQVRQLCNNVLYVLQHSYYKGEDSHMVELSKEFMKQLRDDCARASEALKAEKAVKAVEAK